MDILILYQQLFVHPWEFLWHLVLRDGLKY